MRIQAVDIIIIESFNGLGEVIISSAKLNGKFIAEAAAPVFENGGAAAGGFGGGVKVRGEVGMKRHGAGRLWVCEAASGERGCFMR